MLGDLGAIAKLTGFPYFPITPLFPWLGLLGTLPLPSKWRIQFHPPVRTDLMPPDAADDQNLVMTVSDQVRDTIQQGLYDNLKLRRGEVSEAAGSYSSIMSQVRAWLTQYWTMDRVGAPASPITSTMVRKSSAGSAFLRILRSLTPSLL